MKFTAKQREQLSRPRPVLFLIILGVFSLPWALLFMSGVKARRQEAEMAVQADAFFAQIQNSERNRSARQFDQLTGALGFAPNAPTGVKSQINGDAGRAYQDIETALHSFLRSQAIRTSGPLDPPPSELRAYLETYASEISAIQTHLLTQPIPQWELTPARMASSRYPFPGFFNVRNVQEILLLSAIEHNIRQQPEQMTMALEASWQLNQALIRRPDLTTQISISAIAEYQAGLLRHFDEVSPVWIERLAQQAEQQSVVKAYTFEAWLLYQIQRESLSRTLYKAEATAPIEDKLVSGLFYWFSPAYLVRLNTIDTAQTTHRALARLPGLEVCSTTQQATEHMLAQEKTTDWNQATGLSPEVLARRWKIAGDRILSLELTQKVLQAKQHFNTTGEWPQTLANLTSHSCAEATWIYQRTPDKQGMSLSLSQQPTPTVYRAGFYLGAPIPFEYETQSGQP